MQNLCKIPEVTNHSCSRGPRSSVETICRGLVAPAEEFVSACTHTDIQTHTQTHLPLVGVLVVTVAEPRTLNLPPPPLPEQHRDTRWTKTSRKPPVVYLLSVTVVTETQEPVRPMMVSRRNVDAIDSLRRVVEWMDGGMEGGDGW